MYCTRFDLTLRLGSSVRLQEGRPPDDRKWATSTAEEYLLRSLHDQGERTESPLLLHLRQGGEIRGGGQGEPEAHEEVIINYKVNSGLNLSILKSILKVGQLTFFKNPPLSC